MLAVASSKAAMAPFVPPTLGKFNFVKRLILFNFVPCSVVMYFYNGMLLMVSDQLMMIVVTITPSTNTNQDRDDRDGKIDEDVEEDGGEGGEGEEEGEAEDVDQEVDKEEGEANQESDGTTASTLVVTGKREE